MNTSHLPGISGQPRDAAEAAQGTRGGAAPDRERLAQAAIEFEALFLLEMLKQMRRSMLSEEDEEPGLGASTLLDTVDSELARHLAGQRTGLASFLLEHAFRGTAADSSTPGAASIESPNASGAGLTAHPAGSALPAVLRNALDPTVTSPFGWRTDPFTGAKKFHQGIDLRAAYGEDVTAAAPGVVVWAGVEGGYGNSVILEHASGIRTRYAHLSEIAVAQGARVEEGSTIGRAGQSGRATGPHLHFEVLAHGRRIDPGSLGRALAAAFKKGQPDADYPSGFARQQAVGQE